MLRLARLDARPPRPPATRLPAPPSPGSYNACTHGNGGQVACLSSPRNRTQPWQPARHCHACRHCTRHMYLAMAGGWRAGLSSRPACHLPAVASLAGKLQCPHTRQWRAGLWQWRAGTWGITSRYHPRDRASQDIFELSIREAVKRFALKPGACFATVLPES